MFKMTENTKKMIIQYYTDNPDELESVLETMINNNHYFDCSTWLPMPGDEFDSFIAEFERDYYEEYEKYSDEELIEYCKENGVNVDDDERPDYEDFYDARFFELCKELGEDADSDGDFNCRRDFFRYVGDPYSLYCISSDDCDYSFLLDDPSFFVEIEKCINEDDTLSNTAIPEITYYITEDSLFLGHFDNNIPYGDAFYYGEDYYKREDGTFFIKAKGGARTGCSVDIGNGCEIGGFLFWDISRNNLLKHIDDQFADSEEESVKKIKEKINS